MNLSEEVMENQQIGIDESNTKVTPILAEDSSNESPIPVQAPGCQQLGAEAMFANADAATKQLKALANINRLMILCILNEGEISVTDLNESIDISQSALSQHLAKLREDDVVTTRRESQTIYYSIKDGVAKDIIKVLHGFYCAE